MIKVYEPEEVRNAALLLMDRGYTIDYETADGETSLYVVTRPDHIRQDVRRLCEVFREAALAHVEHAVAGVDGNFGDAAFERKQKALDIEGITKAAMLAGFAAADAALREFFESEDTFEGRQRDQHLGVFTQ